MNPFTSQTSTYLAIRYSLEFVVVVLGITVSFWFNEWNEHQQELTYQAKDAKDLLQDLRPTSPGWIRWREMLKSV